MAQTTPTGRNGRSRTKAAKLEQRVATLERQVAELTANANQTATENPPAKDWRRTIGMFTDNPGMLEVFQEAMRIREADRERARRRFAKADRNRKRPARPRRQRVKA